MSLLDASDRIVFTKPPHGDWLWFNEAMSVRLIDQSSASTTFSDSTTETTVASLTAPANSLANGGALRFLVSGSLSAVSTGTVTWRMKGSVSGSTVTLLATSGVAVSTSTDSRTWEAAAVLYGQQTGVQYASGGVRLSSPGSGTLLPTTFESVGRFGLWQGCLKLVLFRVRGR